MKYNFSNGREVCMYIYTMALIKNEWGISVGRDYSNYSYLELSGFLAEDKDLELFEAVLNKVISDRSLSKENKYWLYYQLNRYWFITPEYQTEKVLDLFDDLYEDIYNGFYLDLKDSFVRIPKKERNENLVVVVTSQIISMNNGPTKMLYDRCYTLAKSMQKQVLIINTAELATPNGAIEWHAPIMGNYITEYANSRALKYRDVYFAFYQCPQIMPDTSIIRQLLELIVEEKPWCIVEIGGNSITADMLSEIVPMVAIPTVYSQRAISRGQFQMKVGDITDEDRLWMSKHNYSDNYFIGETFTFTFKEQTHVYEREELGIPEDAFAVIAVGGRLDDEIDDKFMNMVRGLAKNDIYTIFAGIFERLCEYTKVDELLQKYTINLGFQEDILAVYECCDIYANPYRRGGGASAAEALSKGLPALSLNYGDAGISAGIEFQVDNFDDMFDEIIRYKNDRTYYEKMSRKAVERAELLTDSAGAFVNLMREMEKREGFF